MKRNSYIIGALAATLAFASCQKEDFGTAFNNDANAVRINASVGEGIAISRSNPTGDVEAQKVFNAGDQIGVSAGTQASTQGEVKYTLTDGVWTPEAGKYLKWETDLMAFTAYYPTTSGTDAKIFTLPTDQSTAGKIAAADYMVFSGNKSKGQNGAVELTLGRKTARIIVNIEKYNDQYATGYSVTKVKVGGNTNGYASGTPNSGNVTVESCLSGSDFYALLTPTTADNDATFLTLTVAKTGSEATETTLTVKGIPTHTEGMSYTYNITVGKNGLTIGNVTVKDWGTEEVISGGEATEVPFTDQAFVAELTTSHGITLTNGRIDPTNPTTLAALEAITSLSVSNKGITSLKGIEYLTGLTTLYCAINSLTALDVSKNPELTELVCAGNSLTTLDVSNNKKLTRLDCINNRLTALNVSNNTLLTDLECRVNYLTDLDITPITATLVRFSCGQQRDAYENSRAITLTLTAAQKTKIDELGYDDENVTYNVK